MAFPSVRSEVAGSQNSNSLTWTITWPATIVAGDLLLLAVGCDGNIATFTTTEGLDQSFNQKAPSNLATGAALTKVAAGTETGTFTLTLSGAVGEQGAWRIAAYQDWFGALSGGVDFGGTTASTSTGPDPNNFSPSWGAADTRFRAQCAFDDGRTNVTGFPTDYTISQNSDASGGPSGAGIGGASRDINAGAQDPSAFTIDRNVAWVSWVTAIRPEPPSERYYRRFLRQQQMMGAF